MALPADLPTSTITFGPYPDSVGTVSLQGLKGKIVPVHPRTLRPVRLVHVESGAVVVPVPVSIEIGEDSTASVGPIPRQGSGKLSPDNFLWYVEWQAPSNAPSPGNKYVALLPDSAATVDYDKLGTEPAEPAVYVPVPPAPPSGGAGGALAGTYPNPGLNETAVDNLLAGLLDDPTSATYAKVAALIAASSGFGR